ILPPSMEELERRLRGRDSDVEAEIARRLKRALEELESFDQYDYIIINDNLGKALEALKSVIIAERCRLVNTDTAAVREKFQLA
ncbi:MAG: guanylate kinase, partial [Nitrospirota bacterium]